MSYAANSRANQDQYDAQQEPTGPVTSDSLAAESIKKGGGFADNENAVAQSVRGSNSTFNTTDTSGATTLAPAVDGNERERLEAKGLGSDEKGVSGIKYPDGDQPTFSGTHSAEGYAGGPSDTGSGYKTTTGDKYSGATGDSFADEGSGFTGSTDTDTSAIRSGSDALRKGDTYSGDSGRPLATGRAGEDYGVSSRPDADTAPNYAATVSGAIRSEGELRPKGTNLTEGGIPETKTFTGDVGGPHDPGRVAEQGFQKIDAEGSLAAGQPKYAGSGQDSSTGGAFDALSSERAP